MSPSSSSRRSAASSARPTPGRRHCTRPPTRNDTRIMRMSDGHEGQFATQLAAVRKIATEVAAQHATDVDAKSRFPRESLEALKGAKLLAAPVPIDLGGLGFGMRELAALCSTLAQACGSSAMVLAMH